MVTIRAAVAQLCVCFSAIFLVSNPGRSTLSCFGSNLEVRNSILLGQVVSANRLDAMLADRQCLFLF